MNRTALPQVLASLSGADRAHLCPGSTALDRVGSLGGEAGSAAHEYLAVLVPHGREAADAELPAIIERWEIDDREAGFLKAKLAKFSPPVPEHALCEVALCLLEDGRVIEVEGGRGRYDVPEGAVIPGSLDVMWSEPEPLYVQPCAGCDGGGYTDHGSCSVPGCDHEKTCSTCGGEGARYVCPAGSTLWICDWKTGADRNVQRAERNRQIRWGAVLAARWTGAEQVVAAIVYVEGTEGRWDYRTYPAAWSGAQELPRPYDRAELAAIEAEIFADRARWLEQRRRREAGGALELVTGGHCDWCQSRAFCPAQVAEVRALIARAPEDLKQGVLSVGDAALLVAQIPRARAVLDAADRALKAAVEIHGPIPLSDGRVYGPQTQRWKKKTFATRETYQVLEDEIGADEADAAFSTSAEAIEDAVKAAHAARSIKRQVAPTMKRLFARLFEAKAITEEPVVHWKAHHPTGKRALPMVEDLAPTLTASVEAAKTGT